MPFECWVWHVLGPPPVGVQQPFPAQHVPELPVAEPQPAGWDAGHVHVPDAQLAPSAHTVPHAPQFVGSVRTRTQTPLQDASPVGQQRPELQDSPDEHATPHAPQLVLSVSR